MMKCPTILALGTLETQSQLTLCKLTVYNIGTAKQSNSLKHSITSAIISECYCYISC